MITVFDAFHLGPSSLVLTLLCIVFSRWTYLRYFTGLSKYPGPFSASFTNLWRFLTFITWKHHTLARSLHEKHGPVVRVGPSSLEFSSLEAYEAIHGFNRDFEKGSWYDFNRDPITQKTSVFGMRTYAAHQRRRRQMWAPSLSSPKVATYRPIIEKHVANFKRRVGDVQKHASSPFIDVASIVHTLTYETMFEIIFGEPLEYTDAENREKLIPSVHTSLMYVFAFPWLPWLQYIMQSCIVMAITQRPRYTSSGNLTGMPAVLAQASHRVSFLADSLSSAIDVTASTTPCIATNLLRVPETDDRRMSVEEIERECTNLIFAGPGSTAAGVTSTLYALGSPEGRKWQERICAECRGSSSSDGSPPLVPSPSSSEALHAVIKESLRLDPPFSANFTRDAAVPMTARDIPGVRGEIPRGTTVGCNLFVLGRSREIWGDDADEWKPGRWLQGLDGDVHAGSGGYAGLPRKPDEKFVSFGKGPRACIGREIAVAVLEGALKALLEDWTVESRGRLEGKNGFEMVFETCELGLVARNGRGG